MTTTPRQRGSSSGFTREDGVTLKEYFEARLLAMDKALELAQKANDIRLANMNEFREAMKDQTGHFVTRTEADARINILMAEIKIEQSSICSDIEVLQKYQATMEGKASQSSVMIAYVIAGISVLLSLWDFFAGLK